METQPFQDSIGSKELSTPTNDFLGLLLTLQVEVARTCILIALSTFAANTIASGNLNPGYRSLIKFFPRESSIFILAVSRFSRFFFTSSIYAPLRSFSIALSSVKESTLRYAIERSSENGGQAGELVAAWTATCSIGLSLVTCLQSVLAGLELRPSEAADPLHELLHKAINGEIESLSPTGEIEMPGWAERRMAPRVSVRCQAIILTNDGPKPAIIRDISTTGIGIETECQLRTGQEISIVVNHTLDAKGTVVWSNGYEFGVKLKRPIQSDDPRLNFCARTAPQ